MYECERVIQFQSKTEREGSKLNQNYQIDKDINLEDYILGETLGKGTFGKVKLAKHKITGEKVNNFKN